MVPRWICRSPWGSWWPAASFPKPTSTVPWSWERSAWRASLRPIRGALSVALAATGVRVYTNCYFRRTTCPKPGSFRTWRFGAPEPWRRSAPTSPARRRSPPPHVLQRPHVGAGSGRSGLRRRPEPSRGQAGSRGGRGRGAQHPAHRAAGGRKNHACPAPSHHPAVHDPRGGAGNHAGSTASPASWHRASRSARSGPSGRLTTRSAMPA